MDPERSKNPTSCSLTNLHRLIGFPPSGRIKRIDEFWVVEVDFIRPDPNDWAYPSGSIDGFGEVKWALPTVFLVHGVHPFEVLTAQKDVIIDLVPVCDCCVASDTIIHCARGRARSLLQSSHQRAVDQVCLPMDAAMLQRTSQRGDSEP